MTDDPKIQLKAELTEAQQALTDIGYKFRDSDFIDASVWNRTRDSWNDLNAEAAENKVEHAARVMELQVELTDMLRERGVEDLPDPTQQALDNNEIGRIVVARQDRLEIDESEQIIRGIRDDHGDEWMEWTDRLDRRADVIADMLTRHRDDLVGRIESAAEGTDTSREQAALAEADAALSRVAEIAQFIDHAIERVEQANAAEQAKVDEVFAELRSDEMNQSTEATGASDATAVRLVPAEAELVVTRAKLSEAEAEMRVLQADRDETQRQVDEIQNALRQSGIQSEAAARGGDGSEAASSGSATFVPESGDRVLDGQIDETFDEMLDAEIDGPMDDQGRPAVGVAVDAPPHAVSEPVADDQA